MTHDDLTIRQNTLVGTLERIMRSVLVHGVELFELAVPMPARLGAQLPIGRGAPSSADPVVLISGFSNTPLGWEEWRRSLMADGFDVHVIRLTTSGLGDIPSSAAEVANYIDEVKRRTGRARVDLVGFSQGGLLARMAASQLGKASSIDRIITLATPHRGVPYRWLYQAARAIPLLRSAIPTAAMQLLEGSDLITQVNASDVALRRRRGRHGSPRYASIFSRSIDPLVTPWSAVLEGAHNIAIGPDRGNGPGPSHFAMYHTSDAAYTAARSLLLS